MSSSSEFYSALKRKKHIGVCQIPTIKEEADNATIIYPSQFFFFCRALVPSIFLHCFCSILKVTSVWKLYFVEHMVFC